METKIIQEVRFVSSEVVVTAIWVSELLRYGFGLINLDPLFQIDDSSYIYCIVC